MTVVAGLLMFLSEIMWPAAPICGNYEWHRILIPGFPPLQPDYAALLDKTLRDQDSKFIYIDGIWPLPSCNLIIYI